MNDNPGAAFFEMWKKQMEEGAQAWTRLMTHTPPPPDPASFWWKPVFEQGLQQWAKLFAQTPVTPDLMGQWKQFLDQSIEAWSRALSQAMNTEAFAQMLGRSLEQWMTTQAPLKKAADQSVEAGLQALNLPSRTQVTALAKQVIDLEDRLERIEEALGVILRRLDERGRPTEAAPAGREGKAVS